MNYTNDYTLDVNGKDCGGHGTNVASIATGASNATGQDAAGYRHGLGVAPYAKVGASKIFRCSGSAALPNYATLTANA